MATSQEKDLFLHLKDQNDPISSVFGVKIPFTAAQTAREAQLQIFREFGYPTFRISYDFALPKAFVIVPFQNAKLAQVGFRQLSQHFPSHGMSVQTFSFDELAEIVVFCVFISCETEANAVTAQKDLQEKFAHMSLVVSGISPAGVFVLVLFETEKLANRFIEQLSESEELWFLILQEMPATDILRLYFTPNSHKMANPPNDSAKPEC
ncbi:MAG: hypothetical protein ACE5OZ_18350 [Candidatus Heimdallarchaeota archaeon]